MARWKQTSETKTLTLTRSTRAFRRLSSSVPPRDDVPGGTDALACDGGSLPPAPASFLGPHWARRCPTIAHLSSNAVNFLRRTACAPLPASLRYDAQGKSALREKSTTPPQKSKLRYSRSCYLNTSSGRTAHRWQIISRLRHCLSLARRIHCRLLCRRRRNPRCPSPRYS